MAEQERDERVSGAYRALGREAPPPALDAAILTAARRSRWRWAAPVSIAAVVVLAVGVTLRVQLEAPPEERTVALSPRVLSAPEPASAPPPTMALSERAADQVPRQEVQGRIAPAAPAAAVAKLAGKPETPEAWLERIARLRSAGKDREADESLAQFRRAHPGYEIPEAMRARIERRPPRSP